MVIVKVVNCYFQLLFSIACKNCTESEKHILNFLKEDKKYNILITSIKMYTCNKCNKEFKYMLAISHFYK